MPNWFDYPHEEPCPCCGRDMRFANGMEGDEWHEYLECVFCGHSEHNVTPQDTCDVPDDDNEDES